MQLLKFGKIILEEDLLSRVMGPDMFGAYYYVTAVIHSPGDLEGKTVALCRPLPPDETRFVQDEFKQMKVTF